jgi:hypothetical protein
MTDPGFPVFDANDHLCESPAWLDYLPKRYARDVQFVDVLGRTSLAIKGKLTEFIPSPTFVLRLRRCCPSMAAAAS